MNIEEILKKTDTISQKIEELRRRTVMVPLWSYLLSLYEPASHKVMTDIELILVRNPILP